MAKAARAELGYSTETDTEDTQGRGGIDLGTFFGQQPFEFGICNGGCKSSSQTALTEQVCVSVRRLG